MSRKSTMLAFAAALACRAWAGFTNSVYLDDNYDATQPLQNGTVYVVTNSVTFQGGYDGKSSLAVAPGAEVVIFVKQGARLYAAGRNGDAGGAGGGAGILCPESSTLVITGPGSVQSHGGAGTGGGNMNSPDNYYGYINADTEKAMAYKGGDGGAGGAGGGAGIGGAGGTGGNAGRASPESPRTMDDAYNKNGTRGADGGAGGDGGSAGTVWMIGTAQLWVRPGAGGGGGAGVANPIVGTRYENPNPFGHDFCIGGARPGGAGAGGMDAAAGIGGGGAGGGGGGSGGNGGYYSWFAESNPSEDSLPSGGRGFGGRSENGEADGAQKQDSMGPVTYKGISGGAGGAGGAAGTSGTGGKLYMWSTASLTGSVAGDNIEIVSHAPAALGYRINFNAGESGEVTYKDVTLGVALGFPGADLPKRFGKQFGGWYSGAGGTGVKWFNADGSYANAPETYETVGDTELYAKWSDIQNFNPEDYRLDAAGIELGSGFITIPVAIQNSANLDYALEFVKVYASESLPVQKGEPVQYLNVETVGGRKVLVIRREIAADSMFYLIDVGD